MPITPNEYISVSYPAPTTKTKMVQHRGSDSLDKWFLIPVLILAFVLLGIAIQFNDTTANAYSMLAFMVLLGFIGSRVTGLLGWQGFGGEGELVKSMGLGVVGFGVVQALGVLLGVPFSIASGVLDVLYRVLAASVLEEGAFRSFLHPTVSRYTNSFTGAVVSGGVWAVFFHVAVLRGDPVLILPLWGVGVGYALLNEYAKSALPSYIAHFLGNFYKVVVLGL